ncbi:unnamed protein product [Mycena citricolor]|uniref:Uncharacterized protein n=1 Tax=Mycena citricolor TaxID=2018698 RepID=A0AAD2I163_9AGAR|nr:unnamed protein product [Mycena citricolor]
MDPGLARGRAHLFLLWDLKGIGGLFAHAHAVDLLAQFFLPLKLSQAITHAQELADESPFKDIIRLTSDEPSPGSILFLGGRPTDWGTFEGCPGRLDVFRGSTPLPLSLEEPAAVWR